MRRRPLNDGCLGAGRISPLTMFARLTSPTAIAAVAVCLAATVPFLSTLGVYFLGDDFGLIHLFSRKPSLHWLTLFTRPWTEVIYGSRADELRPMVALSYQIDWMAGGVLPQAYHVSSIVFHMINSLLVLWIARGVVRLGLVASAFAALLFAVMSVHVETVAWISGRADSIPALFYLSALIAYARWRQTGRLRIYGVSLAAFFLALFSKQSAITMVGTLVLYDWLMEKGWSRRSWKALIPYVPFGALTVGYLALRFVLFGNVVREQTMTVQMLTTFVGRQARYLARFGLTPRSTGLEGLGWDLVGAGLGLIILALLAASFYGCYRASRSGKPVGRAGQTEPATAVLGGPARFPEGSIPAAPGLGTWLFFGPAWWVITIAPLVVTYFSSRHLYLPSVGVALVLAMGAQALWGVRSRTLRSASTVLSTGLLLGELLVLLWGVEHWNAVGRLSEKMHADLQREIAAARPGSLVLLGAPPTGDYSYFHTWSWAFALPFVLEPPFMPAGLAGRVSVVSRPLVYCCPNDLWLPDVHNAVSAWAAHPGRPPVVALAWALPSGELIRRTDSDDPSLRERTVRLLEAQSPSGLSKAVDALLRPLGGTAAR